jgi:hypothetical protein
LEGRVSTLPFLSDLFDVVSFSDTMRGESAIVTNQGTCLA